MQGFMRQRGQAWELRVYLGRDPVSGRKRWATKTVRGGKREAQRVLTALVAEADKGALVRTQATVGELLERWFEQARQDFSPKTVLETRGLLDRYLLPGLGHVGLHKLKPDALDGWYRSLCTGGGHGGRPLAPATVRRIHGVLRRALGQGVRWGWIAVNPATATTPPRVPLHEINPPAPAEVARLFALAGEADPRMATFIVLAAATGARRSELHGLRWRDVNLESGVVEFRRGIVMGPDGIVEKDTKTHAARRVSLDPTTGEILRQHRHWAATNAARCEIELGDDAFVFSHEVDGSKPWLPHYSSRAFAHLCRRAGLQGIRLHDLRHYVATRLLAMGVDVRTVAGRLGHRNSATTLNVYSHFLSETDRDAANVLGRLFDDAVEKAKL